MKKYNGTEWVDTTLRQYKTATDTFTTLPADIYADGNNATVGISGNTVQSGTPTPDNPIMPQGTGERTENLLATLTENYAIDASGNINSNSSFMYYTAPCEANETYTFSLDSGLSGSTVRIHAFNGDTWIEQLSGKNINLAPFTVTTPANTTNLKISITKDAKTYHTMLNVGETPLPYEPYGYKIPISSANTTTPVYLGEVESIRKIKKLVLTGEENWSSYSGVVYLSNVIDYLKTDGIIVICTHYRSQSSVEGVSETEAGHITFSKGSNYRLCIRDSNYTTGTNFKTYLAAQYAAGTPVTVWYVLVAETTGIVNEPIRKIGDYADTVSGITIPTIAGKDAVDVETTLKPSEVELTYTGWHDATVEEWDGSQWNE